MNHPFESHNHFRVMGHDLFAPNVPKATKTPRRNNCRAPQWLFAEFDEGTIEEQKTLLTESSLPVPTCTVFSGNKSVHAYWRLVEPTSLKLAQALMHLLLRRLPRADQAIQGPEHLMRWPGSINPKSGKAAAVLTHEPMAIYGIADLHLFPIDTGPGSGVTRVAMEAAEHLSARSVPPEVLEAVGEAYGWRSERLEPVLNPAARKAEAKAGRLEVESVSTRDLIRQQVATIEGLAGEVMDEFPDRLPAQALALRKLCTDCSISLTDQQVVSFLQQASITHGLPEIEILTTITKVPEAEWCGPFLHKGVTLLAAQEKTGKTWLLTELAARALGCRPQNTLAGKPVPKVDAVMMVLLDQGPSVNTQMLQTLGMVEGDLDEVEMGGAVHLVNGLSIVQDGNAWFNGGLARIKRWCSDHACAREEMILIIDTLSRIRPPTVSENSADMAAVLAPFNDLPGSPTVIISHHTGKQATGEGGTGKALIRGSTAITGSVDWIATLCSPLTPNRWGRLQPDPTMPTRCITGEGRNLESFEVIIHKHNYEPVDPSEDTDFGASGAKAKACSSRNGNMNNNTSRRKGKQWDMIIAKVKIDPGCNQSQLANHVGLKTAHKTFMHLLQDMEDDGYLERRSGSGRTYSYHPGPTILNSIGLAHEEGDADSEAPSLDLPI